MKEILQFAPFVLGGLGAAAAYGLYRLERAASRFEARREHPLAGRLPYWAFVDGPEGCTIVGVDLTYSAVLELEGLDTDCMDAETLNQRSAQLHGVLQNLPAGTRLQFLHWTDDDVTDVVRRYQEVARGAHPIGRQLIDAKAKVLVGAGGLRRTRLLLVVSAPSHEARQVAQGFGLAKPFPRFADEEHEAAMRNLRTLRDQVAGALQAAGVAARGVSAAETRRVVYQFLNPDRAVHLPDPGEDGGGWLEQLSAREQLVYTGVEEQRDRLLVGEQLVRVVTLKLLPTHTEPAMLEALLVGLRFHARVTSSIEVLDTLKAGDRLKKRRDQARMLATWRGKRNNEAEAQWQDLEDLVDQMLQATLRLVRVQLSVVLSVDRRRPDAEEVLERRTSEVLQLIGSLHGAQGLVEEWSQQPEWLATLPGHGAAGSRWRECTSENAAHLMLAWQSWGGAAAPTLLFYNGRGNLVGIDPFEQNDPSLNNFNAFMAGTSGSGKSTTTNYLLMNQIAAGAGALVVDVGGSYRRLMHVFGGEYFELGAGQIALNPFFKPRDFLERDGSMHAGRLQLLSAVVERMVCDGVERSQLRNLERAVLIQAIELAYRRRPGETPILSDLEQALRQFQGEDAEVQIARWLALQLKVWTDERGPYARMFNRPSSIDLTTSLAAFDMKGLESQPHVRDVVTLIVSGVIWNLLMRDGERGRRKVVVFDEAWKFMQSKASAALMTELYRTSRKYKASVLAISQSVEDFQAGDMATALIENSATTYLLRREKGHEEVAKAFKLNSRELYAYRRLEMRRGVFSEVLLLHGRHRLVARVVLTPFEYWLSTTHAPDLQLEHELGKRHPSWSRLELLSYLAAHYPRGADAGEVAAEAA